MFKFLSIVMIFVVSHCYGQSSLDLVTTVLAREQSISGLLSDTQLQQRKIFTEWYKPDSLDFDIVAYRYIFNNKGEVGRITASKKNPDYQIVVYTSSDSIFFKSVYKIKYIQHSGRVKMETIPVFSAFDTTKLLKFVNKHNDKYHSSWGLRHFTEESFFKDTFGFECGGMVSFITPEVYALAKLVKANDLSALKILASSFSAQERAYGSAGLFFLKLKGNKLSQDLLYLIEINQQSKTTIDYCEPCISGKQSLKDALDVARLHYYYKRLMEAGVL